MIDVVLMDIEGTTTSIAFVHEVLFPYARERMAGFLAGHIGNPAVADCLEQVRETVGREQGREPEDSELAAVLVDWIDRDRKHPALKQLQGMIWRAGYEQGDYVAHLYDDVKPAMTAWRKAGKVLAIYSSGSVAAQKLLFAHTRFGDLTDLISFYFDTRSGHKRQQASYACITTALGVAPDRILFLSDVPEELDAARGAGLKTTQLLRPGIPACDHHATIPDFSQLRLC